MSTTTTTKLEPARVPTPEAIELQSPGSVREGPVPEGEQPGDEEPAGEKLDRKMLFKLCSAGFCFFVAGVNDGSVGALIPYVIRDHDINTAIVSSM